MERRGGGGGGVESWMRLVWVHGPLEWKEKKQDWNNQSCTGATRELVWQQKKKTGVAKSVMQMSRDSNILVTKLIKTDQIRVVVTYERRSDVRNKSDSPNNFPRDTPYNVTQKEHLFRLEVYKRAEDFTSWSIEKGRENCLSKFLEAPSYVKGAPFSVEVIMKGAPFLSKMVYQSVGVWT